MTTYEAQAFTSTNEIIRVIEGAVKALKLAQLGLRPFSYSYYFDDRRGDRCGPMKGIIWGADLEDARRRMEYGGYDLELTELPWSHTLSVP